MQNFTSGLKSEFTKYRHFIILVFLFCMMSIFSFLSTSHMRETSAANLSSFNPGNIISDAVMGNYQSMSVQEIQEFLSRKNSCDNRNYDLYLQYKNAHPNIDWHWEGTPYNGHFVCLSEERFGDGENIGEGMTAAEIIYDAAQKSKINPQVLIVLIQKETSLITDKVPNNLDYRKATGYGCPDTAACNSKYFGFKNQIYRAAELFRYTLDHGYVLYPEGKSVYIGYHPSSACGGTTIQIANRATAALYRYTPYQPNSASLNAGYGVGDTCSSYGNRNFYLYFHDWFGSTQAAVDGEAITIPDGEYSLTTKLNPDNVLEVVGSRTNNGSNVQLWDQKTSASQKWFFERQSNGYYTIKDVYSQKVLDLANASMTNGSNVQIYTNNNTCAQQWKIYQTADGYLTFESACQKGTVLDVSGDKGDKGANVQIWLANASDSQKWQLHTGHIIEDGDYTIRSSATHSRVLEAAGGGVSDGTNVQLWVDNTTIAQKWGITYDEKQDAYTIMNQKSNKLLTLANTNIIQSANIHIQKEQLTCARYWKIIPTKNHDYTFISACNPEYVMDLQGGNLDNGTNIQTYKTNNTSAQKWSLTSLPDNNKTISDGLYVMHSDLAYSRVIEITGGLQSPGNNVQLWVDNTTNGQKWRIEYNSTQHAYRIANYQSDLVLYAGGENSGSNVFLNKADGLCGQYWHIQHNSDGTYSLNSKCNQNLSLDVNNASTEYGTNIWMWSHNTTSAQKWHLAKTQ